MSRPYRHLQSGQRQINWVEDITGRGSVPESYPGTPEQGSAQNTINLRGLLEEQTLVFLITSKLSPDSALKKSDPRKWLVPPEQPRYNPHTHGLVHTIVMTQAVQEACWWISACQLITSHWLGAGNGCVCSDYSTQRVTWITLSAACCDGNTIKHFGKHECTQCERYNLQMCPGSLWLARGLRFQQGLNFAACSREMWENHPWYNSLDLGMCWDLWKH